MQNDQEFTLNTLHLWMEINLANYHYTEVSYHEFRPAYIWASPSRLPRTPLLWRLPSTVLPTILCVIMAGAQCTTQPHGGKNQQLNLCDDNLCNKHKTSNSLTTGVQIHMPHFPTITSSFHMALRPFHLESVKNVNLHDNCACFFCRDQLEGWSQ